MWMIKLVLSFAITMDIVKSFSENSLLFFNRTNKCVFTFYFVTQLLQVFAIICSVNIKLSIFARF